MEARRQPWALPSGVVYLVLWTVSLIDLELTYQAMLPCQPTARMLLSLPPHHQGYKYTSPCLAFYASSWIPVLTQPAFY